jgi:probable rRNA maturation factor
MSRFFLAVDEGLDEDFSALENALTDIVDADIDLAMEVIFVDEEQIRSLNNDTRGIDKVTDVLSYPTLDNIKGKPLKRANYPLDIDEDGRLFIGSVAVCIKRAEEQAEEYGHSFKRELFYLITHGVFHCLGYDHMTDEEKAEMREKEESVLGKIGINRE